MGTIDFYGTIHIKRRQTSKGKVANTNAIAHYEWNLSGMSNYPGADLSGAHCKDLF